MKETNTIPIRMIVYASMFAALTAAGSYIAIPIGPVPIVLQNLFILLCGLLLGSKWASTSVMLYLFLGAIGLPVFAGGTGGIAHFAGPTGGYLIAYLPAVFVIGKISERENPSFLFDLLALITGSAIIYVLGVSWLKIVTGMSFTKSLSVGVFPFLIGDTLKIVAAVLIARYTRPIVQRNTQRGVADENY